MCQSHELKVPESERLENIYVQMAHMGYGKVSDVWLIQAILAKLIELTYITKPHKPTLRTYLPKSDRFLASKAMCILSDSDSKGTPPIL